MSGCVFESVNRVKRVEFLKIFMDNFFKVISKYNIVKVIAIIINSVKNTVLLLVE